MPQRLLFVRAINVGGATMPMAAFRDLLAELGATGVATLIASGNAVVDIDGDPAAFDRRVEAGMRERFGFDREVISRDVAEVAAALAEHPLPVEDLARSYVCFLDRRPTAAAIETAGSVPTGADRWVVGERDLHLRFDAGAGNAELDLARLLKALGVVGTARNLRTVERVIDLAKRSTER